VLHSAAAAEPGQTLASPDGTIVVTVTTGGRLSYHVTVDGQPVLGESRLGLRLAGGIELGRDVAFVKAEHADIDSTWENRFGKFSKVRDHHAELLLTFHENSAGGRMFKVLLSAFDDGVALRYILPMTKDAAEVAVVDELTEFAFTGNNVCFAGDHYQTPPDHDLRGGFAGSQEWEFRRRQLADLPEETVTGLPLLTQTPAAWVAITEADLLDWSGMWLSRAPAAPGATGVTLYARLAPSLDGSGLVKAKLPHSSPWRVLIIGREPGRLVESNIVLNLSTPSQIEDTSWIKPGLMAWDHWWSGDTKADTATIKQYIQLAADMGWPYQLIDWHWYGEPKRADSDITKIDPAIDMDEVRRFAAERNVRLWLWLYWTDADQHDAYLKAFPLYEQWGIAGVKIDFMDRDDQVMVNWYEKMTRAAAASHLMINFHGAYKPTGLNRTWPNQITREGVMGNEYNKWSTRITPEHKVTLPFTRFMAGPADFTPGGFLNRPPAKFQTKVSPTQVQGTRASELALFVVYDSPIGCVCDHPDNIRGQPGADFLKVVPTVWDETRVLDGAVGEHIVTVRRSGNDWFLGALTNSDARTIPVKLDFLGAGAWKLRWWHDAADSGENAEHIETEERTVTAKDALDLRLAPAGGAVAHFMRADTKP
jgi:alpha-glucosidase